MGPLLAVPFLLLLVVFTLSNPQAARLGLWPFDVTVEVPIAIAILVSLAVGTLFGGLMIWFPALRHRLRARRAEDRVRRLEATIARLQAQLSARLPAQSGPKPDA